MSTRKSDLFEETLAFHCAPVLLGAKSANLVSFSKETYPDLLSILQDYNQALQKGDLFLEAVCECGKRTLVLVYRKSLLLSELTSPEAISFLAENGYPKPENADRSSGIEPDRWLQLLLDCLKMRMASCGGFPHEIRLFLGYPLSDVIGFIENHGKDYLLNGYWKVYSDAEQRKKTFARYTACRDYLCRHIMNGDRLLSLLSAA